MSDGGESATEANSPGDARISPDEVYCTNCGEVIYRQAEICPECGVRQIESTTESSAPTGGTEKDPGIAAVLSFFVTGVGQIYNGQIGKGLVLMFVQLINFFLMAVLIGFITFPLVWIYGIYDAYKVAERINERGAVA